MTVGNCYLFGGYIVKITYIGDEVVYFTAYTLAGQPMYFSREKEFVEKLTPIDSSLYDKADAAFNKFKEEFKEIRDSLEK